LLARICNEMHGQQNIKKKSSTVIAYALCGPLSCLLNATNARVKLAYFSKCLRSCLSLNLSISFPVVQRLLVFRFHSCRFTASSGVKFLCFITLSTSFPHFTSLRPRQRLPSGDHVIILLGHLLS